MRYPGLRALLAAVLALAAAAGCSNPIEEYLRDVSDDDDDFLVAPTTANEELASGAQAFTVRPSIPRARVEAAAVLDGRVYLFGGDSGTGPLAFADRYDPAADAGAGAWTQRRDMPRARADAAAFAIGASIYVLGGTDGSFEPPVALDILTPGPTPQDDVWTSGPDLLEARRDPATIAAGGRIFVFGGFDAQSGAASSRAERFDPAGGGWVPIADLPTARGLAAAFVHGGRIHVVGGAAGDGTPLATVEAYDPAMDSWETRPSLVQPIVDPQPVLETDSVFVFQSRRAGIIPANQVERYEVPTGASAFIPYPITQRLVAAAVFEGRVHGFGGLETVSTSRVFRLEPSGAFAEIPGLGTARQQARAVVLADRVLVLGGYQLVKRDVDFDPNPF